MGETIRGYDIVVVKRKNSIRPIVYAFTVVYDSVQRIDENGSSDLGTLSSAKASILVNGSPSKEFSCHRGLKQGDPLAPYLFILVMESLHISFSRAVDEGLFKGIFLPNSISTSHLFYTDDAMFLGEWSDECSSRLKAWDDIISKLRARLSKWKVKTLSIGGRLTLLKYILGASPIYNMSIFKTRANLARRGVRLESPLCPIPKGGPRSRSGRLGFLRSASHPRLNLYWRVFFRLLGGRFGGSEIGPYLRRILLDVRSFLMT
nr:hypothetical protein [Tanacetum cinerariifolium]